MSAHKRSDELHPDTPRNEFKLFLAMTIDVQETFKTCICIRPVWIDRKLSDFLEGLDQAGRTRRSNPAGERAH